MTSAGDWGDGLPGFGGPDADGLWGDGLPDAFGQGDPPPGTPQIALTPTTLNILRVVGLETIEYESIVVTNPSAGTLDQVTLSESADWLDVWVEGSGNTQTIGVRALSAELDIGVFSAEVVVAAANASNSPQSFFVNLTVSSTAAITPVTPSIIIWVATTGSDNTGTGSQATPYKTIERALLDFVSGSQIRLLDGTYTPTTTVLISGVEGSIFSETPGGATIQPQQATVRNAAVAILDSDRFTVQGINIIQSEASGHTVGLYAEDVTNFIAHTCSVSAFDSPSGFTGIWATGSGKVENCTIEDVVAVGGDSYGIRATGIYVIDCTVRRLSNSSTDAIIGIDVSGS